MTCPVCSDAYVSKDVSEIDSVGRRVILQGKINAVVAAEDANFSPFSDWYTVTVYPRRGKVKYLKFGTKEELDKWFFFREERIKLEGCLHHASNGVEKELVFDVTSVERT
ncbi:MAG: hypothetical protein IH861_09320 [Chloroflexi bacterium]|nr:hypothetical protein [Chloroflexota bacterium]